MDIPETAAIREYFSRTLVIMMMSPSRYPLASIVRRHYAPFFSHMIFCGPKDAVVDGISIEGHDIVYGNEQYRAVRQILSRVLANESNPQEYDGMFYISDDVLIQTWSIVHRQLNRSIPWAAMMGIANTKSHAEVKAVPGMSVQRRYRDKPWPYWRKNRGKLTRLLLDGGIEWQNAMRLAAKSTSRLVYRWSKYPSALTDEASLKWSVFYTIVDTYYVPRSMWEKYIAACALMAKHWVFGECAIATALRYLHPNYEQLDIQFYWSTLKASECHRSKWHMHVDGIHRCQHNHPFAEWIYHSDRTRQQLLENATMVKEAMQLKLQV